MKTIDECKNEAQMEATGKPFDVEWGGEFTVIVNVMERAMELYADHWKKIAMGVKESSCNEILKLKQNHIKFAEHLLHGNWRLNPHSEKTLWRTISQVEQLGGSKPIDEGITTEQVYELFKALHP